MLRGGCRHLWPVGRAPVPSLFHHAAWGHWEHGKKAVPPCLTSQENRLFASAVKAERVAKSRTFTVGAPEMDAAVGCPRDLP